MFYSSSIKDRRCGIKTFTKALKIVVLATLVALLAGCFSSLWTINLKSDGSGTIRMEYKMDKQVMSMAQGMGGSSAGIPSTSRELLDEESLDEMAAQMGPGVRLISAEALDDTGQFIGYTALFEFDDINGLKIDPMEEAPDGGELDSDTEELPFTFSFTRGATSKLVVLLNQEDDSDEDFEDEYDEYDDEYYSEDYEVPEAEQEQTEQMLEMMKPFFRSMAFGVEIIIEGDISSTNATHRDGNRITLINMDMDKIIDNDALFMDVVNSEDMQDEKMQARLEEVGLQIEAQEEVFVHFR
ncbi:MAG: hypothetical protein R6V86_07840 [Spirochaetia bacterium]